MKLKATILNTIQCHYAVYQKSYSVPRNTTPYVLSFQTASRQSESFRLATKTVYPQCLQ